jgi:hypothetical protein
MRNIKSFIRVLISLLCLSVMAKAAVAREPWKFDMFGRLSCSDELARLDNYSDQLAELPDVLAVVVVYGGRNDTKRGEVVARLFAIRDRLLKKRSIDANRIVLLNGGFREKRETELWIIPTFGRESVMYLVLPSVKSEEARLRKSVLRKWEYVCAGNQ